MKHATKIAFLIALLHRIRICSENLQNEKYTTKKVWTNRSIRSAIWKNLL